MSVNTWGAVNAWLSGLSGEGFTKLGSIVVPTVTGSATDVPLLVKPNIEFTAAMLAKLETDGSDLRFTSDADGLNQLPCEIVDGLDVVWVKPVDVSVMTGATLYVWGDNTGAVQPATSDTYGSEAVWSDFYFVSHDGFTNSVGGATPTLTGSPASAVSPFGISGGAISLNGSSQYGDITTTNIQPPFYFSAWMKTDETVSSAAVIGLADNTVSNRFYRAVRNTSNLDISSFNGIIETSTKTGAFSTASWRLNGGLFETNSKRIAFSDGGLATANTAAKSIPTTNKFRWGADADSTIFSYFRGDLAEIRLSESVRTSDYLSIEYDNQSEPDSWWIATDATLVEKGFSLLGDIKAPLITGTATNVPMLVKPNTEFTVAMKAALDASGGDLRFTSDVAGLNQLPIEIVDGLNIVWTLVPSIASNQLIYVWGDNTGATQPAVDAAFGSQAVWVDELRRWGMQESPDSLVDSTGNSSGYTSYDVADITSVAGLHGNALEFGSTGGWIDVGAITELSGKVSTLQGVISLDSIAGAPSIFTSRNDVQINNQILAYLGEFYGSRLNATDGGSATSTALLNQWVHISSVSDGNTLTLYINGEAQDTVSLNDLTVVQTGIINQIGGMNTGGDPHVNLFKNGKIDSISVTDVAKTSSQISIEYDNQSEPNSWWIATDVGGGSLDLTPSTIGSTSTIYSPTVFKDKLITLSPLVSSATFFAPTVLKDKLLTPATIDSTAVVYTLGILRDKLIELEGISSLGVVYEPDIVQGNPPLILEPSFIPSTVNFESLSITKEKLLELEAIVSTSLVNEPEVIGGYRPVAAVTLYPAEGYGVHIRSAEDLYEAIKVLISRVEALERL